MLWRSGAEETTSREDRYRLGPGLVVSIQGDRRARAHFHAEYASAALFTEGIEPVLEVTIRARPRHGHGGGGHEPEVSGSHKLARWRAFVPARLGEDTMRVSVGVRGPLGLTLVQSYVVEPLVSLAAIRTGSVLLPGGAIARGGKAVVLIGRSRSGKSSLAARAMAAGLRILGDDQVLLNPSHGCLPFPRRLRLYPDLVRTAPVAFAALPQAARGALTVLGAVSTVTRGSVAPPVRVSASEFGAGVSPVGLPIGEVVAIRRTSADVLSVEQVDRNELAAEVGQLLMNQRAELFTADGLQAACAPLLACESAIVSRSLADVPARRVLVPSRWPAEHAVRRLAHELRLER